MRSRIVVSLAILGFVAACGSENGSSNSSEQALPLVTVDSLGDDWLETTARVDQGSSAVDPPCGTSPFSNLEVLSSVVTEFENESAGLGLIEAVVQFSDRSHTDDAEQAWRSLVCPAEQFAMSPLDLDSDGRFGYVLGFPNDSDFAQAVIVTQQDASLSVIVASGPAEQAAEVALSAAG